MWTMSTIFSYILNVCYTNKAIYKDDIDVYLLTWKLDHNILYCGKNYIQSNICIIITFSSSPYMLENAFERIYIKSLAMIIF